MQCRRIREFVQKQKALIAEAPTEKDRDYLCVMWLGFINGLRLAGTITFIEYKELDKEISNYVSGMETA